MNCVGLRQIAGAGVVLVFITVIMIYGESINPQHSGYNMHHPL